MRKFTLILLALLLTGCAGEVPETVPTTAHVHTYARTVTPPSCTEAGLVVNTCECGDSYTEAGDAATGHVYTPVITEPTWDDRGFTTHTCVCGDSFVDSYTDPRKITLLPPLESGEVMRFFDDAVFIGDSITINLRNYHTAHGTLGSAVFLANSSYSVHHAVDGSMPMYFRGQKMKPGEAVAASGAKKVFIQLGVNDVAIFDVERTMEKWEQLLADLRSACPDVEIYIQSATPVFIGGQRPKVNNRIMDEYNARLKVFAEENGCQFIDIATVMKDENGGLKAEYCFDQYIHLTNKGCEVWIEALWNYLRGNES